MLTLYVLGTVLGTLCISFKKNLIATTWDVIIPILEIEKPQKDQRSKIICPRATSMMEPEFKPRYDAKSHGLNHWTVCLPSQGTAKVVIKTWLYRQLLQEREKVRGFGAQIYLLNLLKLEDGTIVF